MSISPDAAVWVVDARLHVVSGLPQTDPNIRVKISAPGDDDCRWATAAVPSLRGTAFLGAWATVVVRGAEEVAFEVEEELSAVQLFKWSRFRAGAAVRLAPLVAAAAEDLERGGTGASEMALVMVPAAMRQKRGNEAREGEAAASAADAVPPTDRRLVRSSTRLMSPSLLIMRLSLRVLPAAAWLHRRAAGGGGAYLAPGAALELTVTPLSRSLHTYGHGGFMGLAPSALADPTWRALIEQLDPAAAAAAARATAKARLLDGAKAGRPGVAQGRVMAALENSPVLAAFGLVRSGSVAPAAAAAPSMDLAGAEAHPVLHTLASRASSKTLLRVVSAKLSRRSLCVSQRRAGRAALLRAPVSQVMRPLHADSAARSEVSSKEAFAARQAVLERRAAAAAAPNVCGYRPLALEWDVWLHPTRPGSLAGALIAHGSAAALVTQAVTVSLGAPGRGCARLAGRQQIAAAAGMSPAEWVSSFGAAINAAVCGDRNLALPLPPGADTGSCWRLVVECLAVEGLEPRAWAAVWVAGDVDSDDVVVPPRRTAPAAVAPDGTARWAGEGAGEGDDEEERGRKKARSLAFYPLPLELEHDDVVVTVRGAAPAPARRLARRRLVGAARVRLDEIVCAHPGIVDGGAVEVEVALGPRQLRRVNVGRQRAVAPAEGEGPAEDSADLEEEAAALDGAEEEGEDEGLSDCEALKDEECVEDEAPAGSSGTPAAPPPPPKGAQRGGARLRLRLSLEEVPHAAALAALGVPPAAATTALAMLSSPGGIYLDVKSAYSTPYDIQLFMSALRGAGVSVRAVCSFSPAQLRLGPIADTVRFFHGLSGLENACDAGEVAPGQAVLFNGASFLVDFKPEAFEHMGQETAAAALGGLRGWPLDDLALRKHQALCDATGVVCGLYVQEPDAAPAGVDALAALVAAHPEYFPLGLAYGCASGRAPAWLDAHGRGFAAQQVVEELAARKDLSSKAIARVAAGEHRSGSLSSAIVLAGRLAAREGYMSYWEQRALCTVLAEVRPDAAAAALVAEIGGVEVLATAAHHWYELITPLTLLEAGWNWGFTKSLLRTLRNRGVLAALTPQQKVDLARFFCGPGMRGYGLTYLLQMVGARRGLHKHAKEGLACLLESCTAGEARRVVAALGGPRRLDGLLRGWTRLSWRYARRVAEVAEVHRGDASALAYRCPGLRYASLDAKDAVIAGPQDLPARLRKPTHTRDKGRGELAARWARRSACCAFTLGYTAGLEVVTLLTFVPCCVLPRLVGVTLKGKMGVSAVVVTLLAFVACFFGTLAVLNRVGGKLADGVIPDGSDVEGATADFLGAVGGGAAG